VNDKQPRSRKQNETIYHNQHSSATHGHSFHRSELAIDRIGRNWIHVGPFASPNFANHHFHFFQMTYIVTFLDGRQVTVWAKSANNAGQAAINIRCNEDEPGEVPPIRSIAQHPNS
jgi:hypothetical protein